MNFNIDFYAKIDLKEPANNSFFEKAMTDQIIAKVGERNIYKSEIGKPHIFTGLAPITEQEMINFSVILGAAKKLEMTADDEYTMARRKEMMRSLGFEVTQALAFEDFLKSELQITLAQFEEQLSEFLIAERIFRPFIFKDNVPTDDELEEMAKKNQLIRPKHIELYVSAPIEKTVYETKIKGYGNGYIDDVSNRPALISDLGLVRTKVEYATLAPEIKAIIDDQNLILGRLSKPISDAVGFIKVISIISVEQERPLTVAERRDQLTKDWASARQVEEMNGFVKEKMAEMPVVIF